MSDAGLASVDEICRVLRGDFAELARRLASEPQARGELTLAQERAVAADPMLAGYRLGGPEKRNDSPVTGLRSWLFEAFRDLPKITRTPSGH